MARKRGSSNAVEKAVKRAAGIKSFDPNMDLGNGLNMGAYYEKIAHVNTLKDIYNTTVALADSQRTELEAAEAQLDDFSARMLAGVGVKYTKNSTQYEAAGGTRTDDINRSANKTDKPAKATKASKADSEGTN